MFGYIRFIESIARETALSKKYCKHLTNLYHTAMSYTYQETIEQFRECYDAHADKFSNTRKKHRPELARIKDHIITYETEKQHSNLQSHTTKKTEAGLTIVDCGCGDGRLYEYISNDENIAIAHYIGIDVSPQFIHKAQQSYTNHHTQRIVDDIIHGLSMLAPESVDIVVCLASFQHIPDKSSRGLFLDQVYRVLRYQGKFISIDRSRSQWFIKKYRRQYLTTIHRIILYPQQRERNTILIPFRTIYTNNKKSSDGSSGSSTVMHNRLYHIFTRKELRILFALHGLIVESIIYSSQNGEFHHTRKQARNICSVVRKDVFVNPHT